MIQPRAYDVRQARSQLPKLIDAVLRGERVIIRRVTDGAEVELIPHICKRQPGRYRGRIAFAPDAFAPMDEEELG